MWRPRSLQQRLLLMLLLPVAALLLGLGGAGFIYTRDYLLAQWRQEALLSLSRASHQVDMRLEQPRRAVQTLMGLEQDLSLAVSDLKGQLQSLPGVAGVKLELPPEERAMPMRGRGGAGGLMRRGMRRARVVRVTSPRLDTASGRRTVGLVFELSDQESKPAGRLELMISFDYLLEGLKSQDRWQSEAVFLVDATGQVLAQGAKAGPRRERLGESGDPLELATLQALLQKPSGTLLGGGYPPGLVSGFHRLAQAPWTLVLLAPGERVLAPIKTYMQTYLIAGLSCLGLVMLLILWVTARVSGAVRQVSQAADQVAQGQYVTVPLPASRDELFRLAGSFNTMVEGLRQRDFIRDTFSRYMDQEVAKKLMSRPEATRLGGVKRPVVILMTDVRGFTQLTETLSPEETITIVNRYLGRLIQVIQDFEGIIVDFLGDSMLVFFDTLDEDLSQACRRGVCCALELGRASRGFNDQVRGEGLPQLATGIGLHAGEVVVGNIGSSARAKYGIVGGPVNVTHRIQSQAEGGEIIVSQPVREILGPGLKLSRSFSARLKGLAQPADLHAVEGLEGCQEPGGD